MTIANTSTAPLDTRSILLDVSNTTLTVTPAQFDILCADNSVNIVGFIPVVPDFVIELRSATDRLNAVRDKMVEYQRLGVRLGLLINPQAGNVEIYRLGQAVEALESPLSIGCEEVMPDFVLSMSGIW